MLWMGHVVRFGGDEGGTLRNQTLIPAQWQGLVGETSPIPPCANGATLVKNREAFARQVAALIAGS